MATGRSALARQTLLAAVVALLEPFRQPGHDTSAEALFALSQIYAQQERIADAIAVAEEANVAAEREGDLRLMNASENLLSKLRSAQSGNADEIP